jgi:transcriptional regulator with XRE-family HTH domain
MTPDHFKHWRSTLGLTQSQAAEALGISPRMLRNYEAGSHPIPLAIGLACAAINEGLMPYAP